MRRHDFWPLRCQEKPPPSGALPQVRRAHDFHDFAGPDLLGSKAHDAAGEEKGWKNCLFMACLEAFR